MWASDGSVCPEGAPSREGGGAGQEHSFQGSRGVWWLMVGGWFPPHQRTALPLVGGASHPIPFPEADIIAGSPPWGPQAAGRWTAVAFHPLGEPGCYHHLLHQSSAQWGRRPSGRSPGSHGSEETQFYPSLWWEEGRRQSKLAQALSYGSVEHLPMFLSQRYVAVYKHKYDQISFCCERVKPTFPSKLHDPKGKRPKCQL